MEEQLIFCWYAIIVWKRNEDSIIKRIRQELCELEKRGDSKINSQQIRQLIRPKNEMLKGIIYCEAFLSPELVEFIYNIPRVINFLEHVRHSPFMPKYIGSEKIKELFKKEEGIEQKLIEETKLEELKVGDKVLINQGSFSSFEGKITRVYNKTQEADVDLNYNNEGKLIVNILLERVPQKFCTKKIE